MYSFFSDLQWKIKFKLIEVYALHGPSGTGKSYNAFNIMEKYNIDTLIDDGIIIRHGSIVAGKSAKKAPTRMEAVRRAIFFEDEHKAEIEAALKNINPKNLLIIGTSKKMISKITVRLGLGQPVLYINIFDIASNEDVEKAKHFRNIENKHVIPVAAVHLGKTFSGGLVDFIEHFFTRRRKIEKIERAVVRPTYNQIGEIIISKIVIYKYVRMFFVKFERAQVKSIKIDYNKYETEKGMIINLAIALKFGENIPEVSRIIQANLKNYIDFFIGMEVTKINISIAEIKK